MDSLAQDLRFESINNLDLTPLSCQSSRLSPAKSTSSIDQFTHHHGKGDSAYSSFSGGSNAPDYSSPCPLDEIHPHSLHYTDLKYVRAVYNPNALNSDSRSMDQLYKSVEALHYQYRQDGRSSRELPPPPPARLDSFLTIRNLENARGFQNPEVQLAYALHRKPQTTNPDAANPRPVSVYGHTASQSNLKEPVARDGADQTMDQQELPNLLSRSPPSFILQECFKTHAGGTDRHPEGQKRRPHSAHGSNFSETMQTRKQPNVINGNIQHKGQYYFVTGVCKTPEPSFQDRLSELTEGEVEGLSQGDLSQHRDHKDIVSSTINDLLNNVRHRRQSSYEIQSGLKVFTENPDLHARNREKAFHGETGFSSLVVPAQTAQSLCTNVQEEGQNPQGREIGIGSQRHHSRSHQIFYCGPKDSAPQLNASSKDTKPPIQCMAQANNTNKGDRLEQVKRQPLEEVANGKINKETTPLLYHLAGESRGTFAYNSRNENAAKPSWKDMRRKSAPLLWIQRKEACARDESHSKGSSSSNQSKAVEDENQEQDEDLTGSGTSMDDCYKKYYKEKLKDAQTMVLMETSYKRKDLQLSWPHRIKQKPEERPSVIHSRSCSLSYTPEITSECPKPAETESLWKKVAGKLPAARIGGRKRLTPEQKKLCYSEPEKLHHLGDSPNHSQNSSLGNEAEGLLSEDDLNEHGLVAARRKMFETRGRALSASSLSKTTLKHIQHKALVAYVERKTGHKTAEPQQPASESPVQWHSISGKSSEWRSRSSSGSEVSRKKLPRPLSAGRVLDSVSSSIRYAQSSAVPPIDSQRLPSWRKSGSPALPTDGKSASAESLLDQPKQKDFHRARSTSSPHPSQTESYTNELPPVSKTKNSSYQKTEEAVKPACRGRAASVMAPRGKSMEELVAFRLVGPPVHSKSSEQLDQMRGRVALPEHEKKSVACTWEGKPGRPAAGTAIKTLASSLKSSSDLQPRSNDDMCGGVNAVGGQDRHSRALESLNFNMETPALDSALQVRTPSVLQESPGSGSFLPESGESGILYRGHPPWLSSHSGETPERDPSLDSSAAPENTPLHTPLQKGPNETVSSTRIKTAPPVQSLLLEGATDKMESSSPDPSQEVSLSRGVTTDRAAWPPAPDRARSAVKLFEEREFSKSDASAEEPASLPPVPGPSEPEQAPATTHPAGEPAPSAKHEEPSREKEIQGAEPATVLASPSTKAEQRLEELMDEIVAEDQSLASVLIPEASRKTTVTLMEQLLSEDTLLMEEHYKRKQEQNRADKQHSRENSEIEEESEMSSTRLTAENPVPKTQSGNTQTQETAASVQGNITVKKRQLMACIEQHLRGLEQQRAALTEAMRRNGALGSALGALVKDSCQPSEYERYMLFIGDLERVVSLLLCLSARLARVQNALSAVDQFTDAEEKQSLDERHRLLCKQRDDAKDLKDNLDRRERVVSDILSKNLSQEQLCDYKHFVKVKASLLIEQKDLEEKVRIGEEQLQSLHSSIPA
ncbi:protein Shroom1 isoform X2 [Amia ocellicauda]|uniref:protein Shroom1 isoform X2 n=1 Tax=Amia ocellicauda TaxID=2972642 RepID=UPI0034646C9C